MLKYARRASFATRLEKADAQTKEYFEELNQEFLSYGSVKARTSLRCVTYRHNSEIIGKIALGGKSLKLYLAIDPKAKMLEEGKYHPRNMSKTIAYKDVPTMLPIKSELAVRKAKVAIQYAAIRIIYKFDT